jgi:hypothetical protein
MPSVWGKTIALFSHYLIEGPDERDAHSLYFARGVGTTFVPFWFFALPEVTVVRVAGQGRTSDILPSKADLSTPSQTLSVRTTFMPTGGTLAAKTQTVKLARGR